MKPPLWINIPDLIVQVAIPVYAISDSEGFFGFYLYTCMLGGPWQLFSHFIHRLLGFSYQRKSLRSYHGLWAAITLLILFIGLGIHKFLPIVALIMGGMLYIFYMFICLNELYKNRKAIP